MDRRTVGDRRGARVWGAAGVALFALSSLFAATVRGRQESSIPPDPPVPQDAQDAPDPQDPAQEEPAKEGPAPPKTDIVAPPEAVTPLPVPKDVPDSIRALVDDLAKEGVRIDFARKQVLVKGAILLDRMNSNYPIEYLLVTGGGYTHEAFGIVRATPSKLNAAFLALGLAPGKTVQFEKKEPPPPMEKLISGEESEVNVIPPSGPVVDILLRWTDEKGDHYQPIEDMIRYLTNGKSLPRRGFCFVGSRFARLVIGTNREERYMADVEGNVVSLYLSGNGNCLFDMNSDEGLEAYLYDINPDTAPKRGTTVDFVFSVRST